MNQLQALTDKTAISLSLLCAIHCLLFPIAVVSIPSLAALPLEGETFHLWLLAGVIPISLYALSMGCKQHQRYHVLPIGLAGLFCLIAALILGERFNSELIEKSLTILGAIIIAISHLKNFRLCQQATTCP